MSEIKRYSVNKNVMSRYSDLDRIVYDTGETIIETSDRIEFPHSNNDQFFTVTIGFENRLDLISYKFYGSAMYWWAIAAASGVYDPFNVNVGDVLRIPPLQDVMGR